jgi:hypothetical protein
VRTEGLGPPKIEPGTSGFAAQCLNMILGDILRFCAFCAIWRFMVTRTVNDTFVLF